jgi:hypothetical protein
MGTTYRGMQMTDKDIGVYDVGQMLMNKAFLSTSKLRKVAEDFAKKGLPADKKRRYALMLSRIIMQHWISKNIRNILQKKKF